MLKDTIAAAQQNDEESLLALIEKFKPLLKKYAYKLHYEDSFFDLQLDLTLGSKGHLFEQFSGEKMQKI